MRFVVLASSGLALVLACSSSSTTTTSTTSNVCCINLRFYDCEDGCSSKCPRDEGRDEECGGKSSSSSSSTSSTTLSSGGPVAKERGDDCTCDDGNSSAAATHYGQCASNVTACNTLDLRCLYQVKTGKGTCVVPCTKKEAGDPTVCPTGLGLTCGPTASKAIDGEPWYACQ